MPSLTTYKLLKQEHNARRGEFKTVHGTVQTPAFQNVATAGAIKGGLSAQDLREIGTPTICISARAINWWLKWAACTSLPVGTAPS